MTIASFDTKKFITEASDAVRFRLVKSLKDLDDDSLDFQPEFCHQFFGEKETVFGFTDLRINIFYSSCDAQIYLGHTYKQKVDEKSNDFEADDVMKIIPKEYPSDIVTNLDAFRRILTQQHSFKPFGRLLHAYTIEKDESKREFHIYKVDRYTPEFVKFYHRIETFALWYIDAASYIDTDDEKWHFYILHEKFFDDEHRPCFGFVGYSCVYNYYAYPENIKPRIGHILILPPYQKSGHGVHLLQTIYNDLIQNSKVIEICAEDPADNFVRLRDYVDCRNCLQLESFKPDVLNAGFTKELAKEMQQKLKIGKRQARRVYEILRLKFTNAADAEEFRKYRLDVKQRLYSPFKKNRKDWTNLNKVLSAQEVIAAAANLTTEQIHQTLQTTFEETFEDYRRILNRLSMADDYPEVKIARAVTSPEKIANGKDEVASKHDDNA